MKKIRNVLVNFSRMFILFMVIAVITGCGKEPVMQPVSFFQEESKEEYCENETETKSDIVRAENNAETEEINESKVIEMIAVYVCGAVEKSGVYWFQTDARIQEAIEAAGGFSEEADTNWLNLADHMTDGSKIYVPSLNETALQDFPDSEETLLQNHYDSDSKIDLNTATIQELQTLPGIGEQKASSIIAFRENNGPFTSIEEIMQISGIKNAVFEKIKDKVTVSVF